MRIVKIIVSGILLLSFLSVFGCSKKEVYEGMYEGINRNQDTEMRDNPGKKQSEPSQSMSYDRYQQERRNLSEGK